MRKIIYIFWFFYFKNIEELGINVAKKQAKKDLHKK
jgi:hypothetical protein